MSPQYTRDSEDCIRQSRENKAKQAIPRPDVSTPAVSDEGIAFGADPVESEQGKSHGVMSVTDAELEAIQQKLAKAEEQKATRRRSGQIATDKLAVFDYKARQPVQNVEVLSNQLYQQLSMTVHTARGQRVFRNTVDNALATVAPARVAPGRTNSKDIASVEKGVTSAKQDVHIVFAIEGTDRQIARVLNGLQAQPEAKMVTLDPQLKAMLGDNLHTEFFATDKNLADPGGSKIAL